MKVLFLTSWYPSDENPTLGNFVARHADAVKSIGHEVIVVHFRVSKSAFLPGIHRFQIDGVDTFQFTMPWVSDRFGFGHRSLLDRFAGFESIAEFKPDIIHGNVIYPSGKLAKKLKEKYKIPLVFTEHWNVYNKAREKYYTTEVARSIRIAVKHTEIIMPVSEELGAAMRKKGYQGDYQIVNNTVDTRLFKLEDKTDNSVFQFLHISTFDKGAKNTHGIIRSFNALKDQKARLVIAGDGDIEGIKDFAVKAAIDCSRIAFLGTQEYSEVAELMKQSHCHVLFSNYENLPCVIAESHCCGLPNIATSVGGIPEMIDSTNGILVAPQNESQLVDAFETVIARYEKYDRDAISQIARARYSYRTIGDRFTKIYLEAQKIARNR